MPLSESGRGCAIHLNVGVKAPQRPELPGLRQVRLSTTPGYHIAAIDGVPYRRPSLFVD